MTSFGGKKGRKSREEYSVLAKGMKIPVQLSLGY